MPKSALPERLQDPANWIGTDDDVWYMRWRIPLKWMFAYGPRATEKWAKWREWPKTLFAVRSKQGIFRVETEAWTRDSSWDCAWDINWLFNEDMYAFREGGLAAGKWHQPEFLKIIEYPRGYLSRVQYYTRWHFQLQWPFMVAFHFYFRAKDVPEYGKPRSNTDNKLFYFYLGAHRDADKVYWFPSAFIGLTWK